MVLYFVIINLLTFLLFAIDKAKAKVDAWRISERMLMLFSIAGGSVGALTAMIVCRHKTRKPKFKFGIPAILIMQIVIICLVMA